MKPAGRRGGVGFMGRTNREIVSAFRYLGTISFGLAFHIIGGFFLGRYLDLRFGTEPVLTMLCSLAGVFIGFYSIYKAVMRDTLHEPTSGADNASGGCSEKGK